MDLVSSVSPLQTTSYFRSDVLKETIKTGETELKFGSFPPGCGVAHKKFYGNVDNKRLTDTFTDLRVLVILSFFFERRYRGAGRLGDHHYLVNCFTGRVRWSTFFLMIMESVKEISSLIERTPTKGE